MAQEFSDDFRNRASIEWLDNVLAVTEAPLRNPTNGTDAVAHFDELVPGQDQSEFDDNQVLALVTGARRGASVAFRSIG